MGLFSPDENDLMGLYSASYSGLEDYDHLVLKGKIYSLTDFKDILSQEDYDKKGKSIGEKIKLFMIEHQLSSIDVYLTTTDLFDKRIKKSE